MYPTAIGRTHYDPVLLQIGRHNHFTQDLYTTFIVQILISTLINDIGP